MTTLEEICEIAKAVESEIPKGGPILLREKMKLDAFLDAREAIQSITEQLVRANDPPGIVRFLGQVAKADLITMLDASLRLALLYFGDWSYANEDI